MKKYLALGLAMGVCLSLSPAASAGYGSISGMVGMKSGAEAAKGGFYSEADFWYNLNSVVAFGTGVGFSSYDGLDDVGKFMMIPALLNMRISTPTDRVKFYGEGGVGYYFFDFKMDPSITSELAAYGIDGEVDFESTTGTHFGGGMLVALGRSTVLGLSVRRVSVQPQATVTLRYSFGQSLTLSGTSDQSSTVYGLNLSVKF